MLIEQIRSRPTCDVNGIIGGYTGEGTKTVIPAEARAKISFRLVGDQDPEQIREAFDAFVRARIPADCTVEFIQLQGLARDPACPTTCRRSEGRQGGADARSGARDAVTIGAGGSIPIVGDFKRMLGIDTLLVGFGLDDDRIHSPNEKYDLTSFHKGTRSWARILAALAAKRTGKAEARGGLPPVSWRSVLTSLLRRRRPGAGLSYRAEGGAPARYRFETRARGYCYLPPRRPGDFDARLASLGTRPRFSILTPVYNVERRFLEAAVASVTAQWYPDWELILVDDAGTEPETRAALATIADPRITVRRNPENRGIAATTNAALALAQGDYVVFLDHDDELPPDCLYELARAIDRTRGPTTLYSDEDKVDPEGLFSGPFFKPDWSPDGC